MEKAFSPFFALHLLLPIKFVQFVKLLRKEQEMRIFFNGKRLFDCRILFEFHFICWESAQNKGGKGNIRLSWIKKSFVFWPGLASQPAVSVFVVRIIFPLRVQHVIGCLEAAEAARSRQTFSRVARLSEINLESVKAQFSFGNPEHDYFSFTSHVPETLFG
jgi:hypothetical protein